jgi:hypothetical protein
MCNLLASAAPKAQLHESASGVHPIVINAFVIDALALVRPRKYKSAQEAVISLYANIVVSRVQEHVHYVGMRIWMAQVREASDELPRPRVEASRANGISLDFWNKLWVCHGR